jgi:hypothetical protein
LQKMNDQFLCSKETPYCCIMSFIDKKITG